VPIPGTLYLEMTKQHEFGLCWDWLVGLRPYLGAVGANAQGVTRGPSPVS